MPWTVDDVERHNHGLSDSKKRQWVAVANSALERCMNDGGSESTCAASAIRQANGVVAANNFQHYRLLSSNYEIRYELHRGVRHMVVPVVMMTEGVHAGSHGPLLHLADDLGRFPGSWNGIPISISHPEQEGINVSANDPHIIDSQVVGRVYNTRIEDGKLKAEAWINESEVQRVSPEAYKYLVEKLPLDVSIGVFTEDEMSTGDWNGEHYEGIARNHRPDHLALLPGGVGACSWSDGCGIRVHQGGEDVKDEIKIYGIRYSGKESTSWSRPSLGDFGVEGQWQDLSASERGRVASHFLVGTSSAGDFGELKFPVVNPKTGKLNENALRAVISGRGAQANISAAQRVSARRTAYRLLNSEFGAELEVPNNLSEMAKEYARDGISLVFNQLSYNEIAQKIQTKLDRMDDDMKLHYLMDAYENNFVYRVDTRGQGEGSLFRRGYKVNDDGSVEFTNEPEPVVRKIEYVTTHEQQEKEKGVKAMAKEKDKDKKPCCAEKVELLIQSEQTHFDESDREWLLAQEESVIDKLAPKEQPVADPPKTQEVVIQVNTREEAINVLKDELKDQGKFLALLPPEIRANMEHGLKLYKEDRSKKIAHILANTNEGVYTQEKLEAMPDSILNDLASAIKAPVVDYSPLGPTPQVNESAGEILLPPGVAAN